jgi:hypothetical protein
VALSALMVLVSDAPSWLPPPQPTNAELVAAAMAAIAQSLCRLVVCMIFRAAVEGRSAMSRPDSGRR